MPDTRDTLHSLATACLTPPQPVPATMTRAVSIWEITTWILPMAPEHLRRVLAQTPDLPQGSSGTISGTRWFSLADVATLRAHFAPLSRRARYAPQRPSDARAPLIALTAPQGGMGRSTALLHLAVAASLAGFRVLVIDADPSGRMAQDLGAVENSSGDVLSLIARDCAWHLRRMNADRIDRGEPPLPVDDTLSAALEGQTSDAIQATAWPGLDVIAAKPALMQADLQLARWQQTLRRWPATAALAATLDTGDLRARYDLILCDTPRGLGPLALAVLGSADAMLAPLPLRDGALATLGAGAQGLATAMADLQAGEQAMARALGQPAAPPRLRRIAVLPTRAGPGAAALTAYAASVGPALLPAALPEIPQLGRGHFYDLDYRDVGRLAYAPLRQSCDDAWRGVADLVADLWADVSPRNLPAA